MDRINTSTATSDRKFTEGSPESGTPATVVSALWLTQVQEEIANVILAAGFTLSAEDDSQLRQAIVALIAAAAPTINAATEAAAGIVELATIAEAIAGTDEERAVTPAGLKAALSTFDAGDDALEMALIFNTGR